MRCDPSRITAAHFSSDFELARRTAHRRLQLTGAGASQRPFKQEGFNVFIPNRFHFAGLTQGQMTVEPTAAAKETAELRLAAQVGSLLPDTFHPGAQACLLATNADPAYCRRVPPWKTPLCTCNPLELMSIHELQKHTFVQVVCAAS